jgi:hypothetical protein
MKKILHMELEHDGVLDDGTIVFKNFDSLQSLAHPAMFEAMREINESAIPSAFHFDGITELVEWSRHPELFIVKDWLKLHTVREDELEVIFFLAKSIRSEWTIIKRRTIKQHKEIFQNANSLCIQLIDVLKSTESNYIRDGGHGLACASVWDLLNEDERKFFENVFSEKLEGRFGLEVIGLFPKMETLLERVANAAKRLEEKGPIHSQPTKRGAERGYFVRRLAEIFTQRYNTWATPAFSDTLKQRQSLYEVFYGKASKI